LFSVLKVTNTGGLTLGFWSNSKHDGIWDQPHERGRIPDVVQQHQQQPGNRHAADR
jgi:hypothetical protein